jgi:hypothetical protein
VRIVQREVREACLQEGRSLHGVSLQSKGTFIPSRVSCLRCYRLTLYRQREAWQACPMRNRTLPHLPQGCQQHTHQDLRNHVLEAEKDVADLHRDRFELWLRNLWLLDWRLGVRGDFYSDSVRRGFSGLRTYGTVGQTISCRSTRTAVLSSMLTRKSARKWLVFYFLFCFLVSCD